MIFRTPTEIVFFPRGRSPHLGYVPFWNSKPLPLVCLKKKLKSSLLGASFHIKFKQLPFVIPLVSDFEDEKKKKDLKSLHYQIQANLVLYIPLRKFLKG